MDIFTYAKVNVNTITEFQLIVELYNDKLIKTSLYINNMGTNKEWVGDIEKQLATYIFDISIVVYRDYYLDENEEIIFDNLYHFIIDFNYENKNNEKKSFNDNSSCE